MSQDIPQWLAEIQTLRQQLAEAHQERDRAYASALNWQKLYEAEARQRRTDAALAQQTLEELRQQLAQRQNSPISQNLGDTLVSPMPTEIEQLSDPAELKQRLVAALQSCDRWKQALEREQDQHAQTRKSLTLALGDAIDLLSKGR